MIGLNAKAELPSPYADCHGLVERVAVAADCWQWDEAVESHPHARPDDPNVLSLRRCTACGCCWFISWQFEIGAVYAEQVSEPEYRERLGSAQSVPPARDEAWWLVKVFYGPAVAVAVGLVASIAWVNAGRADVWEKIGVGLLLSVPIGLVGVWGIVRAVRAK
jgi:hypothetical protein